MNGVLHIACRRDTHACDHLELVYESVLDTKKLNFEDQGRLRGDDWRMSSNTYHRLAIPLNMEAWDVP